MCSGIGGIRGRTLHPHDWRCRHAISDSKKQGEVEGGGERSGCGWLGLLCVEVQKLVQCSVGAALNGVYSSLEPLHPNPIGLVSTGSGGEGETRTLAAKGLAHRYSYFEARAFALLSLPTYINRCACDATR